MTVFLWDGWEGIARTALVGTVGYAALVALIRISGKRTLAQMNNFDFIITVALGAAFGRVLTARDVGLVEALAAFALLVGLQFVVTWTQVRSGRFTHLVTAPPTLLYYKGEIRYEVLRKQRLTPANLDAAVRREGLGSLSEAEAVVLEGDGELAVVVAGNEGDRDALNTVDEA